MSTLHDDLTQLTGTQPAQPADRLSAVTGRARRMRRTRALATGAALLVAATSVAGLVQLNRTHQEPLAATPVTTWPDRSEPDARSLGQGAIDQLRNGGPTAVTDVRYLYRGVIDLPDHTKHAVVIATAKLGPEPTLLAMGADRSAITDSGASTAPYDSPTPWVIDIVPLEGSVPSHVGYVVRDGKGSNELFSLDPPETRALSWRQLPIPHADVVAPQPALSGTTTSDDGVFTAPLPGLVGPVRITLGDGRTQLAEQPLTSQTIELAAPPQPAYGSRADENGGGGGPGTSLPDVGRPGRWLTTSLGVAATEGPHFRLYVRCYGGGTQTYRLSSYGDVRNLATGAVTCDGQSRQAIAYEHLPTAGFYLDGYSDRLQGYYYRYVTWP